MIISSNHFYGVIPRSLEQLVSLENLDVSENSLNGTIPQNIDQLSNLQGEFPDSFGLKMRKTQEEGLNCGFFFFS